MTITEYSCSLVTNDTVKFANCKNADNLEITFKRTIRVPDNDRTNCLPPDMGNFGLYRVMNYSNQLPAEMVAKGGLFLPMYQREAMWINFKATSRFAVKIYCGGVNIVSGEHANEDASTVLRRRKLWSDGKSLQDYLIVPRQQWIDGIATSPECVRQFVAMRLGDGYSVEAQLTGYEETGGLQFEITPAVDPKLFKTLGTPKKGSFRIVISKLHGDMLEMMVTSSHTIKDVKLYIEDNGIMPAHETRLIFAGQGLKDEHSIEYYNIQRDSVIHMVLLLRGGSSSKSVEMGLAAGGKLEQKISEDDYPRNSWRDEHTTTFNVQILDSNAFQSVTGLPPPNSPITAKTYADYGLPFFKLYEEPSGICGTFDHVQSVAQMDHRIEPPQRYPLIHLSHTNKHFSPGLQSDCSSTKTVADPDGIVNKHSALREFRAMEDFETEHKKMSIAFNGSD